MSSSDYERVSKTYVEARRSWDIQPVGVDWHDFLRRQRPRGKAVAPGFTFRFARRSDLNQGLQFRCTVGGVTSGEPDTGIRWPVVPGAVTQDGGATWIAEAISGTSLETTISADDWPAVTGLTLSNKVNSDLQYQADVAGGASGTEYEIAHRVTLANGQRKEWIIVLPVQD